MRNSQVSRSYADSRLGGLSQQVPQRRLGRSSSRMQRKGVRQSTKRRAVPWGERAGLRLNSN